MNRIKLIFLIFLLIILTNCKKRNQVVNSYNDSSATWALIPFVKIDSVNPVLTPSNHLSFQDPILKRSVLWEEKNVLNPAAVVKNGKIYILYRAQDKNGIGSGCSRIGLATSDDGIHFIKNPEPVLYPEADSMKIYEWPGGCEDPRIVWSDEGWFLMTYTAWDGKTARLCEAISTDLIHWQKKGLVLGQAIKGKFKDRWSKSGSVICRQNGDKFIATKINGKFWMYWGDTDIFLAWSENLINWTPLVDDQDVLVPVLKPRPGFFDSDLVEPGPPAFLTDNGIFLIYNGRNASALGDKSIPEGTYSAGQALFDKNDPSKLTDRLQKNFFTPTNSYEITGQVNNVCFLEGLVYLDNNLFLYYGTADSKIAVAIYKK